MTPKESPILEKKVRSFEELREYIENKIPSPLNYAFRGQASAEWDLSSTLDRLILHARQNGSKVESEEQFVQKHLSRFRLEIRGRRGDNPPKLGDDELWALGQHFGLATPLLDWSQSPYISVFFALESTNNGPSERVLWCLHKPSVEEINKKLAESERLQLLFPDSDDNKRLLGQSGLFSKGPVLKSVNEWVLEKAAAGKKKVLIKLCFPGDVGFRREALKKLQLMNITHSALFPDISGASRYCNIVAEDFQT